MGDIRPGNIRPGDIQKGHIGAGDKLPLYQKYQFLIPTKDHSNGPGGVVQWTLHPPQEQ
jgi:hypothetical protein